MNDEIMLDLQNTGALLDGHFELRSGMHSDKFFQAAQIFQYPDISEKFCKILAGKLKNLKVDTVLAPAMGGIVVGYELARQLNARAIFAEKDNDDLILRRGFQVENDENILIAEDVITKGGRVKQVKDLAEREGGSVNGIAVILDRSGGKADIDVPLTALCKFDFNIYNPGNCPLCKTNKKLISPGSK